MSENEKNRKRRLSEIDDDSENLNEPPSKKRKIDDNGNIDNQQHEELSKRKPLPKCIKCKKYHGREIQKWLCSHCYIEQYGLGSYFQSLPSTMCVSIKIKQEMQKYVNGLKKNTSLIDIAINLIGEYALNPMEFYHVTQERVNKQLKLNNLMLENANNIKQMIKTLKFVIDKKNYIEFIDLLIQCQPWMSIKDALNILSKLDNKAKCTDNGYKAIGLMYFVCDAGLDEGYHLSQLTGFCMKNGASTAVCYRFDNFGEGGSVFWCGKHVMRDHPINIINNLSNISIQITKGLLLLNMKQTYI